MDVSVSKDELIQALYVTQSVVERRATMPILSNVLLSTTNGKLRLSSTDLEITAVTEAEAEVKAKGSTTVNAKVFGDIVRELPEGLVRLRVTEGERLEILSGSSKLRIIGVSAEEYPSLPGIAFDVKGKISSKQLLTMINSTIHAISLDETRFNLNGICFEMAEGGKKGSQELRLISTDGHRLAMITRPVSGITLKERIIVPRKGIGEIKKLLEGDDHDVGIGIHEGFLVVESARTKISVRLIDGEFPDYNQVIPKTKGTIVKIKSPDAIQALRRVSLLVTDKGKCVRLDFNKDRLRITSSSPELGDANEELEVEYKGEQISVGFNARYLLDFALSLGETQNLILELHGELGPGRLFGENDESFIGIVMPMRLSQES